LTASKCARKRAGLWPTPLLTRSYNGNIPYKTGKRKLFLWFFKKKLRQKGVKTERKPVFSEKQF
jgi:hypothetical protein